MPLFLHTKRDFIHSQLKYMVKALLLPIQIFLMVTKITLVRKINNLNTNLKTHHKLK